MSRANGVLDLVLIAEWFEKIKSGEKTTEFREVKKSWASRIFEQKTDAKGQKKTVQTVNKVLFSKGYDRKEQMLFEIKGIEIVPGKETDLKIDAPVYAIKLGKQLNIVEWKKENKK